MAETRDTRVGAALTAVDTANRQAVIDFYNTIYRPALAVANDWTGTTTGCAAGSTSAAYANATMDMVNYFRAMTGLPAAIPRNAVKDGKAQAAALMMTANSSLSHAPPTSWTCYTATGAEAAGSSNLALGAAGAAAIALYIRDPGAGNTALGHRRWILYPRQAEMGTGSTSNANDLWVIGNFGARPATPEVVAWPTAGFVPYALVYPRWSLGLNTGSTVDFTNAVVTMTRGATPIALTVLPNAVGYGDNTLAWEPTGLTFSGGAADQAISVEVRNVIVGGVTRDYRYTVTVIDPVQAAPPVTLTVTRAGTGAGTVSSAPAGLDCGSTCGASFSYGATVMLTATSAAGSVFVGWSGGGCSGPGTCTVTPTTATTVTATFTLTPPAYTRYFAEGATSSFFDTRLALVNPGTIGATAQLSFSQSGKAPIVISRSVPARTRVTVDPKAIPGLASAEFSTTITSDQLLVADRTLSWDVASGFGAHAETAVAAPALTWYLAEGATHSGFNLFYLLQNPNAAEAQVRVRFLRPSGAPIEKTYVLPPNSRTNIWVNQEDFPVLGKALAATDVSAVLESTNSQPIIVERALYLDLPGQAFGAGHESAGVTAPATQWFLAEGATGAYFDLFVLVANPGDAVAEVEATYLLPAGAVVTKRYTIAATSRFNIWVDGEDARLADTAVSTTIRSTNGVPVIVERALWWPGGYGQWYEAHNSPGATSTGTVWALADGEVGGPRGVETYILLANTSSAAGDVKVTLVFEDGTSAERTFSVTGNSRFNVEVRSAFPSALNTRFGAIVESQGATPAQIVVERAMYWNALGQTWAAGTNALGTKLQ